ncbi:MAG: ABC transporter ATP-binding protein [Hyphomicrobiales bacterium]
MQRSDSEAPQAKAGRGCQLTIAGFVKRFGDVRAADGIDLTVEPGHLLTLLGPSGCGKTTVLQAIAGFVDPDEGDIRIDGASLLPVLPERRETAMLFQQYALFPHLTVRDNIGFGLRMRGVPKQESAARILEALRLVQIEALADRFPRQLSGGQRQRVALARAVVTRPRILLLDEPFGALDQNLRDDMQVELRKLQQGLGITSLIVTHDQKEALILSDRIAVMNAGRIEQMGTPDEIYDRPCTQFVARFMGVENILPVAVARATSSETIASIAGVRVPGLAAIAGQPASAELAIRAEAIEMRLGVASGDSEAAGSITFARRIGSSVRYEVVIAPDLVVVVIQPRRQELGLSPGQAVALRFPPSRCTLLGSPQ